MANEKDVKKEVTEQPASFSPEMMKMMEKLIPMVAVAIEQGRQAADKKRAEGDYAEEMQKIRNREKCATCGQATSACGGDGASLTNDDGTPYSEEQKSRVRAKNHIMMVVYPSREDFADWFEGAIINGIKYLSNHSGHRIPIPRVAEGGIGRMIWEFEDNEQHLRVSRKRTRNLGSIGPNGNQLTVNPNDFAQGFR